MKVAYLAAATCMAGLVGAPVFADPSMECAIDNGSQVEIGACVNRTLERVDKALDEAYGFAKLAAKELDEITESTASTLALQSGQSAWSTYRDAHCDFVGTTFGGGSGTGIAITGCRIALGRERTAVLLDYAR